MNYIILYLYTNNKKINIKILNQLKNYNHLICLRSINDFIKGDNIHIYNDIFFDFNSIQSIIKKYEYLIYIDDNWELHNLKYMI